MIKNVTSKQKKAAIEALFSSSKDTVQGKGYKFLFWTHDKGLYSGFSRVDKESKGRTVSKYYGFILDLVSHTFSMEGVSGKYLVNNSSNLKEVFAYGKPFRGDHLSSSMEVFKCAGKLLGDINEAEQPNFGRGILRLITEYPSLELVVKEYYPNSIIHEGRMDDATKKNVHAIQNYFDKNNLTSVHKMLHYRVVYNAWKESKSPLYFLKKVIGDSYTENTTIDGLHKLSKYLEVAKDVFDSVDKERGYHDALYWYQEVIWELLSEIFGYFRGGTILNCIKFINHKKGTNGIKNLFRYSYASLYHQQAFTEGYYAFRELSDYYNLIDGLKNVPLYPRYLKTAHDVAALNVKVLNDKSKTAKVAKSWEENHEKLDAKIGNYVIYQALTPKEIVEEGTNNSNCVGGYVNAVARGDSIILFMRNKDTIDTSWVTLEVRNGTLVQAYATFDKPLDDTAQNLLSSWCKSRKIGIGNHLGGASTYGWDKRRVTNKVLPLKEQDKYHDLSILATIQKRVEENKMVVDKVSKDINKQVRSFN